MDKFGIYKLINTFFDMYKQNNEKSSEGKNGFDLSSILFGKKPEPSEKKEQKEQKNQKSPPIQSQMLKTMSQHDEFVNRVKAKTPKKF